MHRRLSKSQISTVSAAGLLITLGIVFGDLGTSTLYVMRAIVAGADTITPTLFSVVYQPFSGR